MPQITQSLFRTVNPSQPSHALGTEDLASATNIDFEQGQGVLYPRRGSVPTEVIINTASATESVWRFIRNYSNPIDITGSPYYSVLDQGTAYRGISNTHAAIAVSTQGSPQGALGVYGSYALISMNETTVKDDGTHATDWIKQSPAQPVIHVNTLTSLALGTAFTVTEGTAGAGTATLTAVTGANNRITFELAFGSAGTNLTVNGTETIGNFGVHFIDLAFDDPTLVQRVSQDWSVGDDTFHNYFHNDLFPQNALVPFVSGQPVNASAQPDPNTLVDNQLNVGTSTQPALSQEDRDNIVAAIRQNSSNSAAVITRLSATLAPWAVARPDLAFVGTFTSTTGADPWSSVFAVRYTIELSDVGTCTIADAVIEGAQAFPLTDVTVGYAWWQTYATLDTAGLLIGESAPSPPTARVHMQNANVTVLTTGTCTGSHGNTHIITYRQGGYMGDAYAVGTATIGTGTQTLTDTLNDIQALSLDFVMERNLYSKANFPTLSVIADPYGERVFVGHENYIQWSAAGKLDSFPLLNKARVSSVGDPVRAIIPWTPGLVIVNEYSIFEMTGNDFDNGDWLLIRSASLEGGMIPRTIIKTPYGIPLIKSSGISMYNPGSGVNTEVTWLNDKYGDIFRGGEPYDPAALKGGRCPAISITGGFNASAAYGANKLFIAAAVNEEVGDLAQTIFVIDFATQRMWWYRYPFVITSLYWDRDHDRLLAGTNDAKIMHLDVNVYDFDSAFNWQPIVWTARTRKFTVNSDTVSENIFIESEGGGRIKVSAIYDGTSTAIDTLTNSARAWSHTALNGTFANSVEFLFEGTGLGTATISGTTTNTFSPRPPVVYQVGFDLLAEPPRVKFYRTDYDEHEWTADKLWDVAYYDLAIRSTGTSTALTTITAVTFVDNTAIMTHTRIGFAGRTITMQAFPAETYGRVAYTTYTTTPNADGNGLFQHWDTHYDARNEPPKINYFRSDITSLEENICDAFDTDINPNGTVTATCFVDNVAISTSTLIGGARQSITSTLPEEQYGRTIYVVYNGTAFKLYKTWFHLRHEPDRWTSFVSDKQSGDEHEWKVFKPEVNCLGNTVLATAYIDGTAVSTHTITGSTRQQYTFSLPVRVFGRTCWAAYAAASGAFKHYSTLFEGEVEPPKVTTYRTGPYPFPSSHYLKTWLPRLDPRTGTITGTLIVDDVAFSTVTFTGDRQQWFTVGVDLTTAVAMETASRWECVYSASTQFKHYETKMESEVMPFGKTSWAYSYRKLGGASQLDLARFWSIDAQANGTRTCTYYWDLDNAQFTTGTITLTAGQQFLDRIALPPGARGRLFQFRILSTGNFKINSVNLDLMQEGIKGLTRRPHPGTPDNTQGE